MYVTSNFDIEDIMSKTDGFKGVYTKSDIPDIEKGESIIINLDDDEGTHWVACFHGDYIEYFDSFGLPPPNNVLNMMKRMNKKALYCTSQIQEATSTFCGYFCMYYIKKTKQDVPIYDILYQFKQLSPLQEGEGNDILRKYFSL